MRGQLQAIVDRYPWWSEARIMQYREDGNNADSATRLVAMLHPTATIPMHSIDIARLTHVSTDDLIDRFLCRSDYRIVAEEGDVEGDILTEAEIDDEDDIVSEELAEIYLAQGLKNEAKEIYRKLSLLNSEKSAYFAEKIENIEKNN
jgi:hypothetical protein